MDEAFVPLHRIILGLQPPTGELRDDDAGVRSYIQRFEIETPVELDLTREDGLLHLGSTPPLYYVDTSLRPAYHRLRFTAEFEEGE